LGQALGRSPSIPEIAAHAGVPVEDVLAAVEAARCYRKTPLTAGRSDDGGDDLDDLAILGTDDAGLDAVDASETIERLLTCLPPRERRIVELRYLRGLTQSRIAELVGVSQVQVSRLLRSSLARMRDTLNDPAGSCAL
jgi:RNA polymerase sigma-B factor